MEIKLSSLGAPGFMQIRLARDRLRTGRGLCREEFSSGRMQSKVVLTYRPMRRLREEPESHAARELALS